MSSETIWCQFAANPAVVSAVKDLLCDPDQEAPVEPQARSFLALRDTCDIGLESCDDNAALRFWIEGGVYDANELWTLCREVLAGLESDEFSYVLFDDRSGTLYVSLSNGAEWHEYITGCGGKSDARIIEATRERDRFELLWQMGRAGKLKNPNNPRVGPVCAQVFATLGHLEKGSELYSAVHKMKNVYKAVAKAFPERASEFSALLPREADKLLDYLRAHADAVPEWDLENAVIELERLDKDNEDPIHNVSIRFRSFGEDFEWSFRHQPYSDDDEIRRLINRFVTRYLAGRIIPVKGGCVYVDPHWHERILRALAPPHRVMQIIDSDDYDAFYALHDTIGYWATALAFELPGRNGTSPQQYMDQHPEKPISKAWNDLN